jgi:preprotein translocase subunit SecA
VLRRLFGSANERALRAIRPLVERTSALEPEVEKLSAEQMRARTGELRERVAKGETLDALIPEAFALVREAGRRVLGQRHYDVQLLGGIVLHQGRIAEMKTGEGKTLVATLPSYLNALSGKGVHVVTVNDYLARRDAEWMGGIHRYLGLEVGCIVHGISDAERRDAYAADITYGQNNEFGFDYLRDNMKPALELYVQRGHSFAIVDEVDSILIDEARTPLIISGPVEDDPEKFRRVDRVIPRLKRELHYTVDEKQRQALLTDDGVAELEKLLGIENLYAPDQIDTVHAVQNALRAHVLYQRDHEYVVQDGQIVIVDEFTGRLMAGRRWSDGLHQAIEAKEGVRIQQESQTYASITFQNYFRMYDKLAGMTGTADTEAPEFAKIYNLDVSVIPTHRPMIRLDHADVVYRTKEEKWKAVIDEIAELHAKGQPILVGTVAIETSEMLSGRLKNRGIRHNVLNAKQHQREAEIIAQAGRLGALTISTNMAGRGTDIVLGGNPEMMLRARGVDPLAPENKDELEKLRSQCLEERDKVVAAGGLHVLGTERHEARRIDNQLRGRSGRQGDPGSSRFFLSLGDELMKRFGGERIAPLMKRLGMEEDEAIEHRMVTRAIKNAQSKVEAMNFDARKRLLEYDDVMNRQRESVYRWRRHVLGAESLREDYAELAHALAEEIVLDFVPERGDVDLEGLTRAVEQQFGVRLDPADPALSGREPARARLLGLVDAKLEEQVERFAELARRAPDLRVPSFEEIARAILLQRLDAQWKDHLLVMDHLKESVSLRGYGGEDPLRVYQKEGYQRFAEMDARIRSQAVEQLFRVVVEQPTEERIRQIRAAEEARRRSLEQRLREQHAPAQVVGQAPAGAKPGAQTVERSVPKVGRNEECPCGSGKKYKKCHGAAA